ncbi:extensin isoform X2 [Ischnura elegans]|uniref:extensin isoform X2 n=1 Tax=Ischnura elegans TaxID=197161 RepID=UPI001ED8AB7B|nr:extensin isoform X2 [Ischnura elegans]
MAFRETVVTRHTTSSAGGPIHLVTETQRSPQSPGWDNQLDALLEDLQTSVSRPGSAAGGSLSRSGSRGAGSINGPLPTGTSPGTMASTRTYREVRTIQQHGVAGEAGQPVPPVRDFNNVQYLMAANPTHIVAERAGSPMNPEYQMSPGNVGEQKTVTAYKTISYQYNTSDAQHTHPGSPPHENITVQPLPPPPVLSPSATPPAQRRHRTPSGSGKVDVQLRQNLNELDNLLDDLNHAQRAAALRAQTASPTGRSKRSPSPGPPEVVRGARGIDSSLLEEPLDHSTPINRHVTQTVRTYRYDTRYGGGDSHDGPHQEGPPTPGRHSLPRQIHGTPTPPRDVHYTSEQRHMQPTPPPSHTTVRTYTYTSPGGPPPQTPPPSRGRSIPRGQESPSPARHHPPTPVQDDDDDRSGPNDPLMPGNPRRTTTTTTVRTYTYQLPGSSPGPDHRPDPQPIPAPPPPAEHLTYHVTPRQPQPPQVTELRPQPNPQTTVVTYKFTTSSGGPQPGIPEPNDRSPRPFPVDETDTLPSPQQPPKRLDDLMASFGDTSPIEPPQQRPEPHPVTTTRYTVEEKVASPPPPVSEGNGVGPKAAGTRAAPSPDRPKTTNIAGPPVYYPPGVEMFAKKDAPVQAKMKESESSSKGESKSGAAGAAVVPVCLPLCCAMPCVIM